MTNVPERVMECPGGGSDDQAFWFCVQTHPKHEHIAAGHLIKAALVEAFNPQIRIKRATSRGSVWFTESAFPGYIFARFCLKIHLDTVRYSRGVTRVVQFNSIYPTVPDFQMAQLRSCFGESGRLEVAPQLTPGDSVRIVSGAFRDLLAVVQSVVPSKQRVRALLDFLGRPTTVELDLDNVMIEAATRPSHPLMRA